MGKIVGKLDTEGKFQRTLNKLSAFIIWGVAIYLIVMLIQSF
ncbi:hypothetical protein [Bacillus rubiinfantis]|nr:hypothetical protein [Bacillus rubiinfantis]